MRDLTVSLYDILDLVNCSEMYGFTSQVLMTTFGQWTGPVSDEEIAEYIASREYEDDDAADPDDPTQAEEETKELTRWRDTYAT